MYGCTLIVLRRGCVKPKNATSALSFNGLLEFQALQQHVEIQEQEHLFIYCTKCMTTVTTRWPNVCIIQLEVINDRGLCNNLLSLYFKQVLAFCRPSCIFYRTLISENTGFHLDKYNFSIRKKHFQSLVKRLHPNV